MLRLSHFLDNQLTDGGEVVRLMYLAFEIGRILKVLSIIHKAYFPIA
jgi:hypothetical protein